MADKRSTSNEGNGFKNAPLGYDKQDVNAYIANLNKNRQQMEADYKLQIADLQKQVEDARASSVSEEQINQLNKEHEEKIMELRKLVLDERRHVAQLEKESVKAQMAEHQAETDMDKLRAIAEKQAKEIAALKKNGGPAAGGNNGAVTVEEAYRQAEKIIESAKAYAKEVVVKSNKYKSDVESKLAEMKAKLESATSDISAIFKQTIAEADSARALADEIPEFDFEELESMKPITAPVQPTAAAVPEADEAVEDSPIFILNSKDGDELSSITVPSDNSSDEILSTGTFEPESEQSVPDAAFTDEADDIFSEINVADDSADDMNSDMSTNDIFNDVFSDSDDKDDDDLSTANVLGDVNNTKPQFVDDFKLHSADEPVEKGEDLAEVEPVPDEKGDDLNADLFEMLIDPSSNKDSSEFESLLAGSKNDDEEEEKPAESNISFTDSEADKPAENNDFDEFADLFVGGDDSQNDEAEEEPQGDENVWDFASDSNDDDDDMSSDNTDFSDLLI